MDVDSKNQLLLCDGSGKRKEQGGYKEKEEKCEQGQNNYKVLILKNNF